MTSKSAKKDAESLAAVLEKIPQMFKERAPIGQRLHEIIMSANPSLKPRLWYGMPGYARSQSAPVLVFFRKDDYVTFGLSEKATLRVDEDAPHKLMAGSWYLNELDEATEARIAEIVRAATAEPSPPSHQKRQ